MIGRKTLEQAKTMLTTLIDSHFVKIIDSFNENEEISVKLSLKFAKQTVDKTAVEAQISFVESKVTEKMTDVIDEKQLPLFADQEVKAEIYTGNDGLG